MHRSPASASSISARISPPPAPPSVACSCTSRSCRQPASLAHCLLRSLDTVPACLPSSCLAATPPLLVLLCAHGRLQALQRRLRPPPIAASAAAGGARGTAPLAGHSLAQARRAQAPAAPDALASGSVSGGAGPLAALASPRRLLTAPRAAESGLRSASAARDAAACQRARALYPFLTTSAPCRLAQLCRRRTGLPPVARLLHT